MKKNVNLSRTVLIIMFVFFRKSKMLLRKKSDDTNLNVYLTQIGAPQTKRSFKLSSEF